MNIEKFATGTTPLEKREDFIFKLVDLLDEESFKLFSDIVDLEKNSLYKIPNLNQRFEVLQKTYLATKSAFEYIHKIEESSYDYATKRYLLKSCLASIVSVNLFLINALFGILSFYFLNRRANRDFAEELVDISDIIQKFDFEKLKRTGITLDNCERFLSRINTDYESKYSDDIIDANIIIESYVDGEIDKESIESLSNTIKQTIISLLNQNLNTSTNNIYELLDLEKNRQEKSFALIKEYKN